MNMRIIQLLTCFACGDGIGNDVMEIDRIFRENNVNSMIYAGTVDPQIKMDNIDLAINFPDLNEQDIVIFHFSIGTELCELVKHTNARVMMIYHNVTPAFFFHGYDEQLEKLCEAGIKQLYEIQHCIGYCMAVSEYNRNELIKMGYECKIDVQPIIIPFFQYNAKLSDKIVNICSKDKVNLLFVGRITPNKKQKDIISAFYEYKKINPESRLILLGSYRENDLYYQELDKYIKEIGLNDVIFTGHIPFDEILTYYSLADLFVCMSEHEGFCIPLLEAMHFNIPILAFASSAVTETIGGASIVVKDKNPQYIALWIDYILNHDDIRYDIVSRQKKRLEDFQYDKMKKCFWDKIKEYLIAEE